MFRRYFRPCGDVQLQGYVTALKRSAGSSTAEKSPVECNGFGSGYKTHDLFRKVIITIANDYYEVYLGSFDIVQLYWTRLNYKYSMII